MIIIVSRKKSTLKFIIVILIFYIYDYLIIDIDFISFKLKTYHTKVISLIKKNHYIRFIIKKIMIQTKYKNKKTLPLKKI